MDVNATELARIVLAMLFDAKKRNMLLTQTLLVAGLRGSGNQEVKRKGVDQLKGYGEAKSWDGDLVDFVIKDLMYEGALENHSVQNGAYHSQYVVVRVSSSLNYYVHLMQIPFSSWEATRTDSNVVLTLHPSPSSGSQSQARMSQARKYPHARIPLL